MPLPTLPTGYQSGVYETLVRSLPGNWFHQLEKKTSPLYPLLWGLSGVLGHVRLSYEKALQAAIPKTSGGPWLSLHLKSIGLTRTTAETDASARTRYEWEFHPTRNTRSGEYAALQHYLGLTAPTLRLESDRAFNRYGQFRIVLESQTLAWSEVDYGFVGIFVRRYVSNGIIPGVDVKLQCLLVQRLKPWRFADQFPMSWNIQGAIWERRSLTNNLRLSFSRSTFAQVSAPEWRTNRDRLLQLYRDAKGDAPGAMFLYLSDEGQCPYLVTQDYDLDLTTANINQTFPARSFRVDGIHFYDELPYIGAAAGTSVSSPYLEAPFISAPATAPLLALPELFTLYAVFPGNTQSLNSAVVKYAGKKFSTLKITRFLPAAAANTNIGYTSPQLTLMKAGPWTLILTMGDAGWGDFPPPGSILTGTPLVELQPKSIWWTDASGDSRSWTALWDGSAVYLAMEFILPRGSGATIRECELRLNGVRIEYRRFGLPLTSAVNAGFMFRVKAYNFSPEQRAARFNNLLDFTNPKDSQFVPILQYFGLK